MPFALFSAPMKAGSFKIPVMVKNNKKGVFVELVKTTAKKAGIQVDVSVMPPKRAIQSFLAGKLDMLFPGLDIQFGKQKNKVLPSRELIYTKIDFAFTRNDKKKINSISGLKGKRVGLTSGYPYAATIIQNKNIMIDWAKSDVSNVKKLAKGRIDVFIVEEKTVGSIKKGILALLGIA